MYRVQYFCPREAPFWQDLTSGLFWKTPQDFPDFPSAQRACDGLVWRYHNARVIGPDGQVVYQI